jgi:hypothetical protein
MATRVRSLVAFLICQGQQELGASANLSTSEQCRNINKKPSSLLQIQKPILRVLPIKPFTNHLNVLFDSSAV